MSRRRVFDIALPAAASASAAGPEAAQEAPAPEAAPAARRGPMASALMENARSLQARGELEAANRAENDALARELVRLRAEGLVVERVALGRIDCTRLFRDRLPSKTPDVEDLKASIRELGLSNPVRLERGPDGRFELIQGWRRLQAFKALAAETGDPAFAEIPAAVTDPDPELETAYRRMVDENLVREDVSFAEMAMLARVYAADPRTEVDDVDAAVKRLFRSASYQKRSYIRRFAELMDRLDKYLRHPAAIPRALGLELRKAISERPQDQAALVAALNARPDRDPETELAILRAFAEGTLPGAGQAAGRAGPGSGQGQGAGLRPSRNLPRGEGFTPDFPSSDRARLEDFGPEGRLANRAGNGTGSAAEAAWDLPRPGGGAARAILSGDRLELQAPGLFADRLAGARRARLERALAAFLAALDDDR